MKIIVVGCGKVGSTIAERLCLEKHEITIVDTDSKVLNDMSAMFDVMGIVGNGASYELLKEADIEHTDLLIAVTPNDEINLLCCLFARKAGRCDTIARVRNPRYRQELSYIKEELGLSMVLNPEYDAAVELSRIIRFPSASKIDTFAKGRVELLKFTVEEGSVLCGKSLVDIASLVKVQVLISAVERDEQVIIPKGNFVIEKGDNINLIAQPKIASAFFKKIGVDTHEIKDVMIIGGSKMAYYLATILLNNGTDVKIIENDMERCRELSELLPKAVIINGDAANQSVLIEEGIESAGAVIPLMGMDESNICMSLYSKGVSKAKIITKVNNPRMGNIIKNLDIDSIITPKNISADMVASFARAKDNSKGSKIETLYKLMNGRLEALEFKVNEQSELVGVPLSELKIRDNVLVGCINKNGEIEIAGGRSVISVGDTVIIITTLTGLEDLSDILK